MYFVDQFWPFFPDSRVAVLDQSRLTCHCPDLTPRLLQDTDQRRHFSLSQWLMMPTFPEQTLPRTLLAVVTGLFLKLSLLSLIFYWMFFTFDFWLTVFSRENLTTSRTWRYRYFPQTTSWHFSEHAINFPTGQPSSVLDGSTMISKLSVSYVSGLNM